ncbi:energy-coupling factor transport system ATP-binding protein [Ruminococcaceae bacterium R-25]|nr:energy-coupling factor transport system ATP-binding protein [Ruminococcaceae bacterium R-25]SUQ21895.1 energy-coupling factor transport system ATP-binding protein [Oscillospiraceae bacterium]
MPEDSNKIEIKDVVFSYDLSDDTSGKAPRRALDGISVSIEKGSYTAILGSNGSGKSTLAKIIDILEVPDSGKVVIFGKDAGDDDRFWEIREHCCCVFQNPDNQIVGTMIEEDVAFGPENLGIPNPELRERVDQALKDVGLYEYRHKETMALSGGQKQKLAIAGALAMRPDILILDEATAMLDPSSRDDFLELVEKMRIEKGLTLITITHDMTEALRCDKIVIVHKGKVALEGTPEEIFLSDDLWKYGLKRPVKINFAFEIAKLTGSTLTKEDLKSNETLIASLIKMLKKPGLNAPENVRVDRTEADENDIIMSVKGLSYVYPGSDTKAIEDINLDIRRGEVLGIVGESGCGKTTLISHMNAILRPQTGDVIIHTKDGDLSCSNKKHTMTIRQNVGLVFQYPEYQLFEETVYKDIAYGLKKMNVSKEEQKELINDAASKVGLTERELNSSPFELSGGQKRRAAMAGVLVMKPGILVLDEPASGLDPKGRQEMFAIIKGLRDSGTTIILVSHNMDEAAVNCDRICLIDNGKIKAVGKPSELFVKPLADELKIQLPRITRFSAVLRTELEEIYPDIKFNGNYFNPEKEAKVIVDAVCKAGDANA